MCALHLKCLSFWWKLSWLWAVSFCSQNSEIKFNDRLQCACVCVFYANNLSFILCDLSNRNMHISDRTHLTDRVQVCQLIVPASVQTFQTFSILLFELLTFSRNSFWLFEILLFHFHRGVAFSFTEKKNSSQLIQLQRNNTKYTFPKRRLHKVERKNSFFLTFPIRSFAILLNHSLSQNVYHLCVCLCIFYLSLSRLNVIGSVQPFATFRCFVTVQTKKRKLYLFEFFLFRVLCLSSVCSIMGIYSHNFSAFFLGMHRNYLLHR